MEKGRYKEPIIVSSSSLLSQLRTGGKGGGQRKSSSNVLLYVHLHLRGGFIMELFCSVGDKTKKKQKK